MIILSCFIHRNNSLNSSKNDKDKTYLKRQNGIDDEDEDMDKLHGKNRDNKNEDSLGKENQDSSASKKNNKQDSNKDSDAHKTTEKHGKDTKHITRKPTKKTVKKTVKKPEDDFDAKLKKLKHVEPPPLAIPDPGDVSFERDSHSAKERKQKIIEELRGQLRKSKNERVDLEKQRDQKVRKAKSLQTQTLQKRNQGNYKLTKTRGEQRYMF